MKKFLLCLVFVIAGCATKQYPDAPLLTADEASTLDCKSIVKEIAKVKDTQKEIERADQFDAMSLVGVAVDMGIGNKMAKNNAKDNARQRLDQLEALKIQRCQ